MAKGKKVRKKHPEVYVERPPACESFDLPSREEILNLRLFDVVQLIFEEEGCIGERMWVKIIDQWQPDMWVGILRDRPMNLNIRYGQRVFFHPFDIINIAPRKLESPPNERE